MTTKPRETQIEDLIQRWREREQELCRQAYNETPIFAAKLSYRADGIGQCADELSALLREEAPPEKCPHCHEGVNSAEHGGNERCFHCDRCDYIGCMWTKAEKLAILRELTAPKGGEE